jgi:hypothetical protein
MYLPARLWGTGLCQVRHDQPVPQPQANPRHLPTTIPTCGYVIVRTSLQALRLST